MKPPLFYIARTNPHGKWHVVNTPWPQRSVFEGCPYLRFHLDAEVSNSWEVDVYKPLPVRIPSAPVYSVSPSLCQWCLRHHSIARHANRLTPPTWTRAVMTLDDALVAADQWDELAEPERAEYNRLAVSRAIGVNS